MPTAPSISPRERDVLSALGERLTNAEIAERHVVSVRTVESHVSSLLRKLDAKDRRELAELAPTLVGADNGRDGAAVPGLPSPLTTFVGREAELAAASRLVTESRVTTVLGPGGVGKTRLATAVTTAFTARRAEHSRPDEPDEPAGFDRAAFVHLVPAQPGYVLERVASSLEIEPAPQQRLADAVVDRLRGRALLVLDNCEHVMDDVADLITLLTAANPRLSVLATSRERLAVPGETVLQLGPLHDDAEAVALFTDRARAVDPGFEAYPAELAELCRNLAGSPLQIELAAARVASLGVAGLRAGLADDPLRLLAARRGEQRHRSLRSVVEWSYRLLTEEERSLLVAVSRFAGSFDLDAAAALSPVASLGAVADVLGRLADKSLVRLAPVPGEPRWSLLAGVGEFAGEQLDQMVDAADVTERYHRWAARRARELRQGLDGDWRPAFDLVADDLRACAGAVGTEPDETTPADWRHGLRSDLARLAYARGFVAEAGDHWRAAAELAASSAEAASDLDHAGCCAHVLTAVARPHYDLLLEAADRTVDDPATRAGCLASAAVIATRFRGAGFTTDPVSREELAALLSTADQLAAGSPRAEAQVAVARGWLSGPALQSVTVAAADAAVAEAEAHGDPLLLSVALDARCSAAAGAGDLELAHRISERRLDLLAVLDRSVPQVSLEIVDAFRAVVAYAVATGALADAVRLGGLADADPTLSRHPAGPGSVVIALALAGRHVEALTAADDVWHNVKTFRQRKNTTLAVPLLGAALAAGLAGDSGTSEDTTAIATWCTRAVEVADVRSLAESPNVAPLDAFVRARVALHTGDGDLAALLHEVGATFAHGRFDGYAAGLAAELAVLLDVPDADAYLNRAAQHAVRNRWVAAILTRARGRRAGDDGLLRQSATAFEQLGADFEAACSAGLAGSPPSATTA
jgi:predicted ATPase/DNA-binding CsgD family transcriptional regulator